MYTVKPAMYTVKPDPMANCIIWPLATLANHDADFFFNLRYDHECTGENSTHTQKETK
jgi:hypothetical protein